jgi:hypothetical protein
MKPVWFAWLTAAWLIATLAGCSGSQNRKQFLAERRADAAGSRLEYFERERLLFVHRPNGEKDGVDFTTLRGVFLGRLDARDSTDGKPHYFWHFAGPQRVVFAPYLSAEPNAVVAILEKEIAGFDDVAASKMVAAFENNRGGFCLLWASAEYLKETRATKEEGCRP